MPLRPITPDELALADDIVDEALAPYRNILSPAEIAVIHECLLDPLLFTEGGRRMLRAALPDPIVDKSGEQASDPDRVEARPIPSRRKR